MAEFSGLAVLVTRPAGQADRLAAHLTARGADVIHAPAMTITPLILPETDRCLTTLSQYDALCFVSANAARGFVQSLERLGIDFPLHIPCYCVGASTAEVLRPFGVTPVFPAEQMDSEGLLALLQPEAVAGRHWLILRGEGGRTVLAEGLQSRGAKVSQAVLYRRAIDNNSATAIRRFAETPGQRIVVAASGETLNNVLVLAGPQADSLKKLPVVLPGARVAAAAREAGFCETVLAANATDNAVLAALQEWNRNHGIAST